MQNLYKLFDANPIANTRISLSNGKIIFSTKNDYFSGDTILKIIKFVNGLQLKYKKCNMPIFFSFGEVKIADKLSYVLFECICYYLIKQCGHKLYLSIKPQKDILTEGIFSSSLKLLTDKSGKKNLKFLECFNMEIYYQHFRRIIKSNEKTNKNYLGKLLQELDTFLKFFHIEEEYRDDISEVITELVGNACEHGLSDCLLDIDITTDHSKSVESIPQQGLYYGINIVIINFSNILLGDGIKDKIRENNLSGTDRYDALNKAYNFHRIHFSNDYSFEDFCNISSLQDKISGRTYYTKSGGTGLTKLICSLQDKSDMDSCYVISGKRCVRFIRNLLYYDNNQWLGFNEKRDFFSSIPNKEILIDCYINFPGTAYNLNFIMKREDY